jgi:hypothetical protein
MSYCLCSYAPHRSNAKPSAVPLTLEVVRGTTYTLHGCSVQFTQRSTGWGEAACLGVLLTYAAPSNRIGTVYSDDLRYHKRLSRD